LIHGGNLLSGRHTIYVCQISLPNVIDTWRKLALRPAHNLRVSDFFAYVIDTWRKLAQRPAHDLQVSDFFA
jgi:hypothetical protein